MGGAILGDTKSERVHLFDLDQTEFLVGYYAAFVDRENNELNVMYFDPTCEREELLPEKTEKDDSKGEKKQ